MPTIEGRLSVGDGEVALVASRFNRLVTDQLVAGAMDCLVRHGASPGKITCVWVPGAFEIPQAAGFLVRSERFAAVVALGAVIRGATPHFEYVSGAVSRGLAELSSASPIPVGFGILTTDTLEQALERAGSKGGNKGWDAALSAIEMMDVLSKLK